MGKDNSASVEANSHRVVKVWQDGAVSGTLPPAERPGLSCVLDTLAEGRADGVILARLDRFARELTIQEAALAAIWGYGQGRAPATRRFVPVASSG